MEKSQVIEVTGMSEKVLEKFQAVTNINLEKVLNCKSSIQLASFDKFSVTDELNLKMLSAQGYNQSFIKLQSSKKATDTSKPVYLFIKNGNKVKSFYKCYVIEQSDKKPTSLKEQKESISIMPTTADNNRPVKKSITSLVSSSPVQKAIEIKQPENFVSKEQFNSLEAKFDLVIEMLNKQNSK